MVTTVHLLQVLLLKLFEHKKYIARGAMGDCITRRFMVFYSLASLPNSVRVFKERMKLPGHVARMGQKRNAHILVDEHERKRLLGRPRPRW